MIIIIYVCLLIPISLGSVESCQKEMLKNCLWPHSLSNSCREVVYSYLGQVLQNINTKKKKEKTFLGKGHLFSSIQNSKFHIILFYYQFVVSKYVNSIAFFVQNNHEK